MLGHQTHLSVFNMPSTFWFQGLCTSFSISLQVSFLPSFLPFLASLFIQLSLTHCVGLPSNSTFSLRPFLSTEVKAEGFSSGLTLIHYSNFLHSISVLSHWNMYIEGEDRTCLPNCTPLPGRGSEQIRFLK